MQASHPSQGRPCAGPADVNALRPSSGQFLAGPSPGGLVWLGHLQVLVCELSLRLQVWPPCKTS